PDSLVGLTVDPLDLLGRELHLWDSRMLLGADNGWGITYLPVTLFFVGLHTIGLPLWFVGRLWLAGLLTVGGLSMAYLIGTVYPRWLIGKWLAAFSYVTSIYVWVYLKESSVLLLAYAFTPLLLAFVWRGVKG